jgi:glycosyltransferase involved in cell wall biosynthesis
MMQPLVSIVTPAYMQGDYLAATIESVLAQDYPNIEFIVIDDGSSDDTLAVARRYEGSRVRVLTQANIGQAATLNRGWALARGEILAYLSSDDCLCPNAVSAMVEALQNSPDVAVVYCDYWLIDAAGQRLRAMCAPEFDVRDLREKLVCQPGPGAFFRRRVFEASGGWDVRRRQLPDFEFLLRAADLGLFMRVPALLSEYRIHEGSASFQMMSSARADEIIEVMQEYWQKRNDPLVARRSLSNAFSMAARHHAQSGRSLLALRRFVQAVRLNPAIIFDLGVWRLVLSGFVRRAYYGARARRESGA